MKKIICMLPLCAAVMSGCAASVSTDAATGATPVAAISTTADSITAVTDKVNLGSLLALYPKPVTVVGAFVQGKPNWLVVGHTGIIGHGKILVSMKQGHYTSPGIYEQQKLSLNLVSRAMLPKADHAGGVSGAQEDKSQLFAWHMGEAGTPVIDESPLTMELKVEQTFEMDGFDNFICSIANTYASKDVLDADNKLDYTRLKPVLFDFPTYQYMATGEILGRALHLDQEPGMCAKESMQPDGIVRLSRIEVDPQQLPEYLKLVAEVGEVSLRTEPGVLSMYALQDKKDPRIVTILETYSSQEAYRKHIALTLGNKKL